MNQRGNLISAKSDMGSNRIITVKKAKTGVADTANADN